MQHIDDLYHRLIDSLRLVASPYEVQSAALPGFVHLPDEMAVELPHAVQLHEAGMITLLQLEEFRTFERYLETLKPADDYAIELENMRSGGWYEALRNRARGLLTTLGETYVPPTLDGVTYVRESNI